MRHSKAVSVAALLGLAVFPACNTTTANMPSQVQPENEPPADASVPGNAYPVGSTFGPVPLIPVPHPLMVKLSDGTRCNAPETTKAIFEGGKYQGEFEDCPDTIYDLETNGSGGIMLVSPNLAAISFEYSLVVTMPDGKRFKLK